MTAEQESRILRRVEMVVSVPAPRADLAVHELDDELVLYDARTSHAYVLNQTGAFIWLRCDGSRTLASIADELATHYGVARARAAADAAELVARLRDAGLLVG